MVYSKKLLRIIGLEDSPSDCELILNELSRHGRELVFKRVNSSSELRFELENHLWDIVISGYGNKSLGTKEALSIVRSHRADIPFILFSGPVGEEVLADLMKAGLEDVVLKSRPERLFPVVKRVLREAEIRHKESMAHEVAKEALKAKEQMLAIVSHDIKNPLFAIQLEAEMLLRAVERTSKSVFSEEVKIQAARILKTTERMKGLITDLLDKNKSENNLSHLSRTILDVQKLLHESLDAVRPLLREKDISLKVFVPTEEIMAYVDRNKMFQVFSNLLNNAIKYTPPGGIIVVEMEGLEEDFCFRITDSGPGLPKEASEKVFEKYWTSGDSNLAGTGLGLYICKTIVEAHAGKISVGNNGMSGAIFSCLMPKDLAPTGRLTIPGSGDLNKKVYIVDDDEDLREVMSWALSKEGYTVHAFQNPHEALDCLRAGRHLPHLIVVDYNMDEMKGSEFVLKKNNIKTVKECPVIMISASPQSIVRDVDPSHYQEVITKPIDLTGLVDNIRRYLN